MEDVTWNNRSIFIKFSVLWMIKFDYFDYFRYSSDVNKKKWNKTRSQDKRRNHDDHIWFQKINDSVLFTSSKNYHYDILFQWTKLLLIIHIYIKWYSSYRNHWFHAGGDQYRSKTNTLIFSVKWFFLFYEFDNLCSTDILNSAYSLTIISHLIKWDDRRIPTHCIHIFA